MSVAVYWTKFAFAEVHRFQNGTDTTIFAATTLGAVDSLILSGNIIYFTGLNNANHGGVSQFNIGTSTETAIASGSSSGMDWQDLVMDPSGLSLVISDTREGQVLRVTISGGSITVLKNYSSSTIQPRGVCYDGSGNLYVAIVDFTSGTNQARIDQINPSTGATINSSATVASWEFDGMCFDTLTGHLFATNTANVIKEYNTSLTLINTYTDTTTDGGFGGNYDGISSIGDGKIYLADTLGNINTLTPSTSTFAVFGRTVGIDDLFAVSVASTANLMFDNWGGAESSSAGTSFMASA